MIFHIHIYTHFQSRCSLIFTCRLWHNVAVNYSLLWKKIGLNYWENEVDTNCHNLYTLARLIRRAGTGFHLKLTIGGNKHQYPNDFEEWFLRTVGDGWVDGIQTISLSITSQNGSDLYLELLRKLLRHINLKSLKIMTFRGGFSSNVIEILFPQMKSSPLELIMLDLAANGVQDPIPPDFWALYSLECITHLCLELCMPGSFIPWTKLTGLKLLDIFNRIFPDSPVGFPTVNAPHLSSLRVNGDFSSLDFFPGKILEGLSQLAVDSNILCRTELPPSFPALTFLNVKINQGLERINAPQLVELVINIRTLALDADYFFNSTITPRIMRICIDVSHRLDEDDELDPWRPDSAQILSRVEELHITSCIGESQLPYWFVRLLQGTELDDFDGLKPCFPKLRQLTARYYIARKEGLTRSEKRRSRYQLLSIMYARMAFGLPKFTKLELGWHPCTEDELPRKWSEEEWFVTEWRDCLQENKDEEWGDDEEEESDG